MRRTYHLSCSGGEQSPGRPPPPDPNLAARSLRPTGPSERRAARYDRAARGIPGRELHRRRARPPASAFHEPRPTRIRGLQPAQNGPGGASQTPESCKRPHEGRSPTDRPSPSRAKPPRHQRDPCRRKRAACLRVVGECFSIRNTARLTIASATTQRRQHANTRRALRPATIRERDGAGVIAFIEGGAPSQRLHWRLPVLVGGSCRVTALLGCRAARRRWWVRVLV